MTTSYKIVGRCYACGLAVSTQDASFVYDPSVIHAKTGKKVRRVVHRDGCRARVDVMFLGKVGNADGR